PAMPPTEAGGKRAPWLEGDVQLEALASVAQVGRGRVARAALARQVGKQRTGLACRELRERPDDAADAVTAALAAGDPERREHAARGGDADPADAERVGDAARVERPGSAERNQLELARIVALLDADD